MDIVAADKANPTPTLEWLEQNASRRVVTVDLPDRWEKYEEFTTLPDGAVYRRSLASMVKANPFYQQPSPDSMIDIEIDGVRDRVPVASLLKRVGQHDDANAFSCWVEYFAEGRLEPVHRSATVMLKRAPGIDAVPGKMS